MKSELFHIVLEASWNATCDVMLVVNSRGELVACNDRVTAVLGWDRAELMGQKVEVLIPQEKRGDHRALRRSYEESPTPRRMGNDMVLFALTAAGVEIPVVISLSNVSHEGENYTLAVLRDARERHAYEEELRRLGFHDGLTGLYNRYYFDEELQRLQRGRTWPITIVMADLDGLKVINDNLGHETGDTLIRRAAEAIAGAVRTDDVVARLGGDEFAALLPGLPADETPALCQRIQDRCSASQGEVPLRISTGCATAMSGANLRAVLREADARMYEVKMSRRGS